MNRKKYVLLITIFILFFMISIHRSAGKSEEIYKNISVPSVIEKVYETNESQEEGYQGKITIATNRTDIVDTVLKEYAREFMNENPGTEIVYEGINEYEEVMSTRVSSGEAPDIYYVLPGMSRNIYSDFFLAIDDIGITDKDIYFYNNCRGTDGKLYALTDTVNYEGIIYNKRAFERAGIYSIPTTVEEFFAVCEKLKQAGITPMGTAYRDKWPIFPWISFDTIQVQFDGENRGANIYLEKDEIIDHSMLKSMQIFRELYKKGYLGQDIMSSKWDQLKRDLASGTTAMYYAETWYPSQAVAAGASEEDIGMFPFPESKYIFYQSGKYWGVSKDSKYPELAKKFLAYMMMVPADIGAVSSNRNERLENPFVKELLSYGIEPMDAKATKGRFYYLLNSIDLEISKCFEDYFMEPDDEKAQAQIDAWNKKWKEAQSLKKDNDGV